jgi:hypothetical protein
MSLVPDIEYDWKALSIKEPAASMIVDGVKLVENRNTRQYKDRTLRGRWIMVHSSMSNMRDLQHDSVSIPDQYNIPRTRGNIIGIALIKEVISKEDIHDANIRQWANDGDACILFDMVLKLNHPVEAPGGLNTWTMKPSPTWTPPRKLSKKEATLSEGALRAWRVEQELKYRKQSLKKRIALVNILMAVRRGEYVVTWKSPDRKRRHSSGM